MAQLYDTIGTGYNRTRQPDPRLAMAITNALGDAGSVLNVGAGAGGYEPRDRQVIAVEPSLTMIRQRPPASAPVVRALATRLPFADASVDAALAILTVHHWGDVEGGLAELRRVSRDRIVILTFDPAMTMSFWLVADYFPEISRNDLANHGDFAALTGAFTDVEVRPLPIPHDCVDGFLGAFWRRPAAYLDAGVRSAISAFSMLTDVAPGLTRLARDLDDGTWQARHGALLAASELDLGYRLVIGR